jgi:UDP-N-acetylglucosamine 2-epimerase (non-hydrolysing)
MVPNQTLSRLSANILLKLDEVIAKEQPDFILVQGDTTTTMVASLVSFYHQIPIGHIEAGLRTYHKYNPFPEEVNRRLTSVMATLHFAPTKKAVENLLAEGIPEENVYLTGNPVIDALLMTVDPNYQINLNLDFENKRIILVTAHRRENFGQPLRNICLALKELVNRNPNVEVVYPVHLNPNVKKLVYEILSGQGRIHLIEPLDYKSFVNLMARCYLILTDSGGIQEEAPSLGKPVLVMRETTERPEAVEAGTAVLIGTDRNRIINETQMLLDNEEEYKKITTVVNPYGDGKAAQKIVRILRQKIR